MGPFFLMKNQSKSKSKQSNISLSTLLFSLPSSLSRIPYIYFTIILSFLCLIKCSGFPGDSVCSINQFECEYPYHPQCIPLSLRCDGHHDCQDKSDEVNCPIYNCSESEFMCNSKKQCIFSIWRCDSELDCEDGSDELDCEVICQTHQFRCANNRCIDKGNICNGIDDCGDQSDEFHLTCMFYKFICEEDEFKCNKSNQCIPKHKVCNQIKDCPDGEDEFNCKFQCDHVKEFQCHNMDCIPILMRCNGQNECSDHSDEFDCNIIQTITNRSDDLIIPSCSSSQRWNPQEQKCFDIDKCAEDYSICSGHPCINTLNGFQCRCMDKFIVYQNYCILNSTNHKMIYSVQNHLKLIRWSKTLLDVPKIIEETEFFHYVDNSSAPIILFDYNIHSNYYVSSNQQGQFYLDRLEKDRPFLLNISIPTIMAQRRHPVRSLAIDWLNHLIYLINADRNQIEVLKITKPNHVYTFVDNLNQLQDIEVNPIDSWIIWSEQGKITQMTQDGLVSKVFTLDIIFPMGLTIDYIIKKIYFLDAQSNSIYSINFDGKDRKLVFHSLQYLKQPFDIDVFDNYLFWSDLNTGMVYVIDKFARNNTIYELYTNDSKHRNIMYLETIHESKQPFLDLKCPLNCPYICQTSESSIQCICPAKYVYDLQCIKESSIGDTKKNIPTTKKLFELEQFAFLILILVMIFLIYFIKYIRSTICTKFNKKSYKAMRLNSLRRSSHLTNGESSSAALTRNISSCDIAVNHSSMSKIDNYIHQKNNHNGNVVHRDDISSGYSSVFSEQHSCIKKLISHYNDNYGDYSDENNNDDIDEEYSNEDSINNHGYSYRKEPKKECKFYV